MSKTVNDVYIYDFMADFDESTMEFVESDWHHAYLTYFNLIPSQENSFTDLEMTQSDIINIIKKYGAHPPRGNKYYRPIPDTAIQECLRLLEVISDNLSEVSPVANEKVTETLLNYMKDGAKKFKTQTGREMTYLEIRSLYG